MVAHPEHGVAVRKLYDPRGISGSEMIARKEQAGRALGANPHFAQFYGSAQTPHGGQMHFSEFIPQGQAPTGQAGAQSVRHAKVQAQRGLHNAGFAGGKDIRQGNMVFDARTNTHKVIDYIPAQQGEFMRMPQRMENVIASTPESKSPWNPNYQPSSQAGTHGGMIRRLVGGQSAMGVRRAPPVSGTASTALAPVSPTAATAVPTQAAGPNTQGFAGVDALAKNRPVQALPTQAQPPPRPLAGPATNAYRVKKPRPLAAPAAPAPM